MKIFAAMAISAGLIAGPMLAQADREDTRPLKAAQTLGTTALPQEPHGTSIRSQDLKEAETLNPQTLSQAITFERQKVLRAEREAKLGRSARGSSGEVSADYVGPSASSTSSADRMMPDGNETQVHSPGAKEYEDRKQDHPTR